jgi:hypothetical protein
MTDAPRSPETGDDGGDEGGMVYDRESTTGVPRWVTLAAIIVAVVALLVVVVLVVGGGSGGHGPSRHGSGASGAQAPPSSAT